MLYVACAGFRCLSRFLELARLDLMVFPQLNQFSFRSAVVEMELEELPPQLLFFALNRMGTLFQGSASLTEGFRG